MKFEAPKRQSAKRRVLSVCIVALLMWGLTPQLLEREPGIVKPSERNTPAYTALPYTITEIQRVDKIGSHTEQYTIILQTRKIPDTSAILRTAHYLWDHRLPRDTDILEIAIYLPGMETDHLPVIALSLNADGIQTLTYQAWMLNSDKGALRYGLSKKSRKQIFSKLLSVEKNATSTNLQAELKSQIREQYQITEETQRAIAFEGIKRQWVGDQ